MKKINFNGKKKKVIIFIIILLILVISIITIYFVSMLKYKKYNEYGDLIKRYNYESIYDNASTKSSQYVTKKELLKSVIYTSVKENDLYDIIPKVRGDSFDDDLLNYAYSRKLVTNEELKLDNLNEKANYLDVIEYISKAKQYLLEKSFESSVKPEYSNFNSFTNTQKIYICDLVSCNIIENNTKKIDINKKIRKGELNKIIILYIQYNNLLTSDKNREIETDISKMPSNYQEYPYILKDVKKEVYEQNYFISVSDFFEDPIELYRDSEIDYDDVVEKAEKYYTALLNIDYTTITVENYKASLENYVSNKLYDNLIENYIKYVKENEIKMSCKVTPQLPAVYSDGFNTRVRLKLDFQIQNTKTRNNLMYLDNSYNMTITYPNDTFTIYIDAILEEVFNSTKSYINPTLLYLQMLEMSYNEISVVIPEDVVSEDNEEGGEVNE